MVQLAFANCPRGLNILLSFSLFLSLLRLAFLRLPWRQEEHVRRFFLTIEKAFHILLPLPFWPKCKENLLHDLMKMSWTNTRELSQFYSYLKRGNVLSSFPLSLSPSLPSFFLPNSPFPPSFPPFFPLIFKARGREEKRQREKETSVWRRQIDWLPPAHALAEPGIKPATEPHALDQSQTLLFSGWWSTHWAKPARALSAFLFVISFLIQETSSLVFFILPLPPSFFLP